MATGHGFRIGKAGSVGATDGSGGKDYEGHEVTVGSEGKELGVDGFGETKSPASGWKQGGGKSLDLCGFQADSGLVLLRCGAGLSAMVIPKYDSGRLPCFAEPMTRHQPCVTSETRTSRLRDWDRWRRIGAE